MFHFQHSPDANAAPDAIYALYSDASSRPAWDEAFAALAVRAAAPSAG